MNHLLHKVLILGWAGTMLLGQIGSAATPTSKPAPADPPAKTRSSSIAAASGSAEGLIHAAIDQGLAALDDRSMSESARRAKIRQIMLEATDMPTIASLTLASNKNKFSSDQLKEFTSLFSKIIFNAYIGRVERYPGAPVVYGKTRTLSDNRVTVPLVVKTSDGDVHVEVSAIKLGSQWRVYDINLEGISMITNYRSQFHDFLVNKSSDALIDLLKQKVARNEG